MKKSILIGIIISLLILPSFALAQDVAPAIDQVLAEIRQVQNVEQNQNIDCTKVSDEQLAKLGDAVMDIMHPDETQHQLMDQMMGGEESQSLKAMHISMGQRYLGCFSNSNGTGYWGMGGMMGSGGMMRDGIIGNNYNYKYNQPMGLGQGYMMGNWGNGAWSWLCLLLGALIVILVILGIAALTKYLFNSNSRERKK